MDALATFIRARLDEAEAMARAALADLEADLLTWDGLMQGGWKALGLVADDDLFDYLDARDPARALREAATWRRVLLEYSIPPGTDAMYGGTERETGFRLALSFTLKAKAAEWKEHPNYPQDGNWPVVAGEVVEAEADAEFGADLARALVAERERERLRAELPPPEPDRDMNDWGGGGGA
jgi:Family of unknown function (DUF6221)